MTEATLLPPTCGCKGIRSCLICEQRKKKAQQTYPDSNADIWHYCHSCSGLAYKSLDHADHTADSRQIEVDGVFVQADFISSDEEAELVAGMEAEPWVESQSGRRKQDFGPKINFKKKKVKADAFQGFPAYSKTVMDRLKTISCLSEFQPVEMCNLEYLPSRGASIDPHHDDFWIWGERLVTVNLLSDTVYSLTLRDSDICVKVPVPQRCIVVLYGEARNVYMHSISRSDITSHRIGITIREFTPPFLEGGELYFMGKRILDKATIRELSPPDNDIQLPGH